MKQYHIHLEERGFTLIETLVAITVLLFAIIGPMTMAQKGIQSAYYANEQFTAIFLAQEAIEAVREVRDERALKVYQNPDANPYTWNWTSSSDFDPSCGTTSGCAYNVLTNTFPACAGANECVLKIGSDGKYTHSGTGDNSPFTRKVTVGAVSGGGVPISVEVSWTAEILGGSTKKVTLQTWVYNHYRRFEPN